MILHQKISDPKLLRREFYNPNKFMIQFDIIQDKVFYITATGISLGPIKAFCMPDGFLILNHEYYTGKAIDVKTGKEIKNVIINLITNFGDSIGKKNKLPSRPELSTR